MKPVFSPKIVRVLSEIFSAQGLHFAAKYDIIVQHLNIRLYLTGEVKMPCRCAKPRVFCDLQYILTNGWSAASVPSCADSILKGIPELRRFAVRAMYEHP